MTADNVRAFHLTTEQPQPASVPYSIFRHVCDERDRLRDDLAAANAALEQITGVNVATFDEQERGEALIVRALQMTHRDDTEKQQQEAWGRVFASPALAALYVYLLGVVDTLEAHEPTVRGWWTPGRVALAMALLAVVAIVVVGW